jgi:hypothetical protein
MMTRRVEESRERERRHARTIEAIEHLRERLEHPGP